MDDRDNAISEYMESAFNAALAACQEKYKANRNPAVAALYDGDPRVRAGAAMMLRAIAQKHGVVTSNTLPVLKTAIEKETDPTVRNIMKAMRNGIANGK